MASPKQDRKILFVARDFATPGLEEALQSLVCEPAREYELRAPGVTREGGEILRDVVLPGIMESRRVLVFVDQPNANVGFEAGLAIGLGKPTVLVRLGDDLQPWLEHPPIINTLVHRLEHLTDLYKLIEDEAIWQQPPLGAPKRARRGRAPVTKFLCPGGTEGTRYSSVQQQSQPFWQQPPVEKFTLQDLPWFFEDTAQVVWAIVQPEKAGAERDGIGNACNAVIAGWFCAQLLVGDAPGEGRADMRERWGIVKRGLRVLRSTLCRPVRDVELFEQTFEGLGDFAECLRIIPVTDIGPETIARPLWLVRDTHRRPLPELLREQVDRMQTRAVELTAGGEFDRALDELRAGDELSASLIAEWPDDVRLKLSRGYLLKTLAQVLIYSGNADFFPQAADRAAQSFLDAVQQGTTAETPAIELAEAINGLGNLLQSRGNLEQAIDCYRQAAELFPAYGAAWHDLLGAYFQLRTRQAVDVRRIREAFDRMKEHGQGQPGLSTLYIDSLEKRLKVLERPMGQEGKMFSGAASELADAIVEELIRRGETDEAIAAMKQELTLAGRERRYQSLVECLTTIAVAFCVRGRVFEAEHPLRAAVGIANAINDHRLCSQQCLQLARYYVARTGDSVRMGGAFAQSALTIAEGLSDDRGRADALQCLAIVHSQVGDLREAERHNREALAIYERLGLHAEAAAQVVQTSQLLVDLARSREAADLLKGWRDNCRNAGVDAEVDEHEAWLYGNLSQLLERDREIDKTRAGLIQFDEYLRSLGFRLSGEFPSIYIVNNEYWLGSYDPKRNVMLLGVLAIGDADIAAKEYVHRALHPTLLESRPALAAQIEKVMTEGPGFLVGSLLAGVSTYLACSYRNDSGFARTVASTADMPAMADLDRTLAMTQVPSVPRYGDPTQRLEAVQIAGLVWGNALWTIRKGLGGPVADRLVAVAWRIAFESSDDVGIVPRFAGALVDQSPTDDARQAVRQCLDERGIAIAR